MMQWQILATVVGAMVLFGAPLNGWALPGWLTSYKAGLAQAQREGRPLIIDFGSATCPACRMLESRTLRDERVQGELDNFVRVYIDGNEQVSLRESFGVQYYPTVVYLSPEGKVLKRHVGYVGPDEMLQVLRTVANNVQKTSKDRAIAGSSVQKIVPEAPAHAQPGKGPNKGIGNLYESVAASGAKQDAIQKGREVAVVPAVRAEQNTRIDLVGREANGARWAGGGGEEKVVAQALPMPKNIETPAPLVNIKPETTPEAPKATATPVSTAPPAQGAKSALPESIKKLQSQSPRVPKTESTREEPPPLPSASAEGKVAAKAPSEKTQTGTASTKASPKHAPAQAIKEESAAEEKKAPTESAKAASKSRGSGEVTAKDIEEWFADAESKLVAGYKKEARAMYAKIVERDPSNKFGKSDLAFIKMVALMVDREDDQLRRAAHAKIKEFLKRFPESANKDYYTVVRAILAADLGDYAEAHALLDRFPEEFPNSRYQDLARAVWEELPKDAKSLQKRPQVDRAASNRKPTSTVTSSKKTSSESSSKSATTKSKSAGTASTSKSSSTARKTGGSASSSKSDVSKSKSSSASKTKSSGSTSASKQ